MSIALAGALVQTPGPQRVLAQPLGALGSLIAQALPPITLSSSTPSPSPTPTGRPLGRSTAVFSQGGKVQRGGPLLFSISGSLALGMRQIQNTRAGSDTPGSQLTTTQSEGTQAAGLLLQAERRTSSTTLTFGIPAGLSLRQRTTFGQAQAAYYTPHFGLQYMPLSLSVLGGVPVGYTSNALSLVFPLRGGDLTLLGGPTTVGQGGPARIYGIRARTLLRGNLVELGAFEARKPDGSLSVNSLVGGFAGTYGKLNQMLEASIQRGRQDGARMSAFGYQYRADYGGGATYSTFTLSHMGDGFISMGAGPLRRQQQESLGLHAGNLGFNELFDDQGVGATATLTRQGLLSYNRTFGKNQNVQTQFTLTDQRVQSSSGVSWLGGAGMQAATSIHDVNLLFGLQATRQTQTGIDAIGQMTYQAAVQKQFGNYSATGTYQFTSQRSAAAVQAVSQSNWSVMRQWGRTALALSTEISHTMAAATDAVQITPTITVSRKISPVMSLSVNVGEQLARDKLNPAANSRTRIFNVQISTPFGVGNGLVQGRANPRLPATISGSVINDVVDQGPLNAAINNGVSNVVVVLDNTQIQRTDLSGRFQFNFVQPGHHTVEVQLASLPRGVTPDQPVASVDVQGGQQGQVVFALGTYGAVQGHVLGKDSGGGAAPLAGVVLSIDNGLQVTTGNDGAFGFGRLIAGAHTITVQTASLPATVSFSQGAGTQKVIVQNGQVATVNFTANGLGSVTGKVVYGSQLAPQFSGGVLNAYVVAEPGDFAAITNDDGSYLLDNVPPGTYSIDVDPETVPADTGNALGPRTVTVTSGDQVQGIDFTIGRKLKPVIFTLHATESPTTLYLEEKALPPGGATEVEAIAPDGTSAVTVTAFDQIVHLHYDKSRSRWIGMVAVPLQARAGEMAVQASIEGRHKSQTSAELRVDPKIPLATFQLTPRRAPLGSYVAVRGRFLADVHTGDKIRWLDGQLTTLSRKLTGRVFEFTVKISEQPMRGFLLTRQGELPITLR